MNRSHFIQSAAVAIAVCAIPAQAAAQAAAAQAQAQAPAQALAQARPAEAIQLTLADAVERAVEHNPDLAIVKLDTEADAARVGESRGAFIPVFSTQFARTRTVTPPTTSLVGGTGLDQEERAVNPRVPARSRRAWRPARERACRHVGCLTGSVLVG